MHKAKTQEILCVFPSILTQRKRKSASKNRVRITRFRLCKTFIGFIIATSGSILFANGSIYIYDIIRLCIEKERSILKLGYYSTIGYVSCDFAFLIGLLFVIFGAYTIYLGAKIADRLTIWKLK